MPPQGGTTNTCHFIPREVYCPGVPPCSNSREKRRLKPGPQRRGEKSLLRVLATAQYSLMIASVNVNVNPLQGENRWLIAAKTAVWSSPWPPGPARPPPPARRAVREVENGSGTDVFASFSALFCSAAQEGERNRKIRADSGQAWIVPGRFPGLLRKAENPKLQVLTAVHSVRAVSLERFRRAKPTPITHHVRLPHQAHA
jgi:hypothetical protein